MSAAKVEREEINPNQDRIDAMRKVGNCFKLHPDQWEKLCSYKDFLEMIIENPKESAILAEKILAGKYVDKKK